MKAEKSIDILQRMLQESQDSLIRNSFFFILWGILMAIAGIVEYLLFGQNMYWAVWPIAGIVGAIISSIYGYRENQRTKVIRSGDRIMKYTWGGFIITLVIVVVFAVSQKLSPAPLVLLLAAYATFVSGGISKVRALIYGAVALAIGGILCAFFVDSNYHGLVFAASIILGYVIPGFALRGIENEKT